MKNKIYIIISLFFSLLLDAKTLIIYGPCWSINDLENIFIAQYCKKEGWDVVVTKSLNNLPQFDYLLCLEVIINANHDDRIILKNYSPESLILRLLEPPVVMPQLYDKELHECFGTIFTWNDSLVDNKKYFKMQCSYPKREYCSVIPFGKKQLAVMIFANKKSSIKNELYSERRNVIEFFEQHLEYDFALYGRGWEPEGYATYKGEIQDKFYLLQHYKFCFAYENMENIDGWITEKILDAMLNGAIPIYKGAQNIEKYIPKECYILADNFDSLDLLYQYMATMNQVEFNQYQEAIKQFLQSEKYLLFTHKDFMKRLFVRVNDLK